MFSSEDERDENVEAKSAASKDDAKEAVSEAAVINKSTNLGGGGGAAFTTTQSGSPFRSLVDDHREMPSPSAPIFSSPSHSNASPLPNPTTAPTTPATPVTITPAKSSSKKLALGFWQQQEQVNEFMPSPVRITPQQTNAESLAKKHQSVIQENEDRRKLLEMQKLQTPEKKDVKSRQSPTLKTTPQERKVAAQAELEALQAARVVSNKKTQRSPVPVPAEVKPVPAASSLLQRLAEARAKAQVNERTNTRKNKLTAWCPELRPR